MDLFFQKIINFSQKSKNKFLYKFFFALFKNFIKGPFVLNFGDYQFFAYAKRKDLSRWMLKNLKPWDFDQILKLKNIIKNSNSLFLDCGSNFGSYSIIIASLCKNTKVISFDASLKTIKRLEENIDLNNLKTIEVHNVGIGQYDSEEYFNDYDSDFKNLGSYRFEKVPNSKPIKTIKLDNFLNKMNLDKYESILIKLDIEGHEYQALLGLIDTIKQYKPIFFIEISRMLLTSKNFSKYNFAKFIQDNHLKILDQDAEEISVDFLFEKIEKLSVKQDTIGDFFLLDKDRFLTFSDQNN